MVLHYKIKKFSACGLVDHLILVLCITWFSVFLLDSLLLYLESWSANCKMINLNVCQLFCTSL
jgi:hypothetical protein